MVIISVVISSSDFLSIVASEGISSPYKPHQRQSEISLKLLDGFNFVYTAVHPWELLGMCFSENLRQLDSGWDYVCVFGVMKECVTQCGSLMCLAYFVDTICSSVEHRKNRALIHTLQVYFVNSIHTPREMYHYRLFQLYCLGCKLSV